MQHMSDEMYAQVMREQGEDSEDESEWRNAQGKDGNYVITQYSLPKALLARAHPRSLSQKRQTK